MEGYLVVDGQRYLKIARHWRNRDGSESSVEWHGPRETTWDEIDATCRDAGWPGHDGSWWNYMKDDARALFLPPPPTGEDG